MLRTVEGLIVSNERKTLAGLYRQWVEAPDTSAVSDFFRASPWSPQEIEQSVSEFGIKDLIERALDESIEPIIYVSIDDSLTVKDKDTKALEGVDWFHDHNGITKKKSHYRNGAVHVSGRVQVGARGYTCGRELCVV